MKPKTRNGKVDLLKFLFSIVIIIYHFNKSVTYPQETFTKGHIGVEFFFITSGFLFAMSLSRISYHKETLMPDSVRFIKKKFVAFFPYHFFFFLITFFYCVIEYHWTFPKTFATVFKAIPDLLLLRSCGISSLALLGHEWYISSMLIAMFILTPIAIRYRKAFTHYICPILCVGLLSYLYQQKHSLNFVEQWTGFCQAGVLRATAELSLGVICYTVYEKGTLNRLPKAVLLAAEIGLYAMVLMYASGRFNAFKIFNDYAVLFIIAPAVLISFSEKASVGFLNNRFVYFLGKLSFPVYLSQIFVRQIVVLFPIGSYWLHVAAYIGCVLALSLVCIVVMDSLQKLIRYCRTKKQKINA